MPTYEVELRTVVSEFRYVEAADIDEAWRKMKALLCKTPEAAYRRNHHREPVPVIINRIERVN